MPEGASVFSVGTRMHTNLTSLSFRNDVLKPRFVVLAHTTAQVATAVKCAARFNHNVCVRSGGHSFIGKSHCAGVMIDLGPMRQVYVHPRWKVATISPGVNMGELLWAVHKQRRWVAAGVCPGVGVGGYTFGGGHGLYEGKLGLMCDSLVEATMVTRDGSVVRASRKERQELFWGLCGAGGAQFGIVTSFKVQTASSAIYDNAVVFRFTWPHHRIGELLEKWMKYDEEWGMVRTRMEIYLGRSNGITGYGACYNSPSAANCRKRLERAAFFRVPGRKQLVLTKVKNALDLHALFGPEGDWGRKIAPNLRVAMLEQRYTDAGEGNSRTFQSAYINSRPDAKFWQRYGDFCATPKLHSIPWVVCELRLMGNQVRKWRNNAYPHRNNKLLAHYIIGGGTRQDRRAAYHRMAHFFRPYITGVYSNYEELELGYNYPRMYWGDKLCRLRKLKSKFDPKIFFANPQPIPPLSWSKGRSKC